MIVDKIRRRYRRAAANWLGCRPGKMKRERPIISFTFDDFPASALLIGGAILEQHGIAGTYYASFGLMGQTTPTGEIFAERHVPLLVERGHELGCHTFDHCDAAGTHPNVFEQSILDNGRVLRSIAPSLSFETLSYPIGAPRPETKRRSAKYFATCRGGGQTYNSGTLDFNRLDAFFLEQSLNEPSAIEEAIRANSRECGWLIFATHDVCPEPTRFGCTPTFFETVVRWARSSGAELLPVSAAYQSITSSAEAHIMRPSICGESAR